MRKALLFSLVALPVFIAGCDNGAPVKSQNVPSKLKVRIERQIAGALNEYLTVYAMDFRKEGRTLTFVCPCHIPGWLDEFLNVQVEGDSFKLTLLPDAEYNVEITYWAPTPPDNNTKVQYQIFR